MSARPSGRSSSPSPPWGRSSGLHWRHTDRPHGTVTPQRTHRSYFRLTAPVYPPPTGHSGRARKGGAVVSAGRLEAPPRLALASGLSEQSLQPLRVEWLG